MGLDLVRSCFHCLTLRSSVYSTLLTQLEVRCYECLQHHHSVFTFVYVTSGVCAGPVVSIVQRLSSKGQLFELLGLKSSKNAQLGSQ